MKIQFSILLALVFGSLASVQSGRAENADNLVSANCALAIFSALQHLNDEAFLKSIDKDLQEFLQEYFRDVRCELRGDETHITLTPSGETRGGTIFYRIGLNDLEIRESRFDR